MGFLGGAEERLKLGEMKKIERTETGVFEVVFETEQEEAGLFELVEGSEDVVGSLKMKKLFGAEGGFGDFVIELGAEMRQESRVVIARGIAGENEVFNAKSFGGAED